MDFIIRKATVDDVEAIGFVHFTSWKETYPGLMPKEFLDKFKMKRCIESAKKLYENVLVAIVDERVVGFVKYLEESRDFVSIKPSSEIMSIYILKDYHNNKIGLSLIIEALKYVTKDNVVLFVLKGNNNAINFYKKIGFDFTGNEVEHKVIGGHLIELEMVLNRKS